MKHVFLKRLAALLTVKSLVALILTVVFAYLAVVGKIDKDFMTIYAMVVPFYFSVNREQEIEKEMEKEIKNDQSK